MQLVASTLLLCLTTYSFGSITIQIPSAAVLSERLKQVTSKNFIEKSSLIKNLAGKKLSPDQISAVITESIDHYKDLVTNQYSRFCSRKKIPVKDIVSIPTHEDLVKASLKDFPEAIRALGYIQHLSVPIKINSAAVLSDQLKKETYFLDKFNEPVVKMLASKEMDSHDLICFLEKSLKNYKACYDDQQTAFVIAKYQPQIFKIFLSNSPKALEYAESIGLLSISHHGLNF